jgi:hypothetical protein
MKAKKIVLVISFLLVTSQAMAQVTADPCKLLLADGVYRIWLKKKRKSTKRLLKKWMCHSKDQKTIKTFMKRVCHELQSSSGSDAAIEFMGWGLGGGGKTQFVRRYCGSKAQFNLRVWREHRCTKSASKISEVDFDMEFRKEADPRLLKVAEKCIPNSNGLHCKVVSNNRNEVLVRFSLLNVLLTQPAKLQLTFNKDVFSPMQNIPSRMALGSLAILFKRKTLNESHIALVLKNSKSHNRLSCSLRIGKIRNICNEAPTMREAFRVMSESHLKKLRCYLQKGMSPSMHLDFQGTRPVMLGAERCSIKSIRLLLEFSSRSILFHQNIYGHNALTIALSKCPGAEKLHKLLVPCRKEEKCKFYSPVKMKRHFGKEEASSKKSQRYCKYGKDCKAKAKILCRKLGHKHAVVFHTYANSSGINSLVCK